MRSNPTSHLRPFDQGAASAKARDGLPNPYPDGSIEFSNYELGKAHALRANPALAMPLVVATPKPVIVASTAAAPVKLAPARRSTAKVRKRA